jgi:formylmethanofuran dehydrogenase subunit C
MTQAVAFTDIKADFTNGSFFTAEETSVTTAGLKMNADGTFTRVAADAADANAVITGKFHSNEHGISNFSATVKVDGPVKVSMGTCAWGGDVTIKDATGATVGTFNTNTGACYHNNKTDNIASTYYKGEATTLTISPMKDVELLNSIGAAMGQRYGVEYLATEFRKKNGYLRSTQISKEYDMYRQDYCGCVYSKVERESQGK